MNGATGASRRGGDAGGGDDDASPRRAVRDPSRRRRARHERRWILRRHRRSTASVHHRHHPARFPARSRRPPTARVLRRSLPRAPPPTPPDVDASFDDPFGPPRLQVRRPLDVRYPSTSTLSPRDGVSASEKFFSRMDKIVLIIPRRASSLARDAEKTRESKAREGPRRRVRRHRARARAVGARGRDSSTRLHRMGTRGVEAWDDGGARGLDRERRREREVRVRGAVHDRGDDAKDGEKGGPPYKPKGLTFSCCVAGKLRERDERGDADGGGVLGGSGAIRGVCRWGHGVLGRGLRG